jgi:exoribonuclease R
MVVVDFEDIRKDLINLVNVARKLREDRLKRGALELESSELRFELNANKDPVNIIPKKEQVCET